MDVDEAIRLLQALKEMEGDVKTVRARTKKVASSAKKVAKSVRKPSAYNLYMKKKLKQLKKKHPKTAHKVLFKRAAASWKRSPERKRSMK